MCETEKELRQHTKEIAVKLREMQAKVRANISSRQRKATLKLMIAALIRDVDGLGIYLSLVGVKGNGQET